MKINPVKATALLAVLFLVSCGANASAPTKPYAEIIIRPFSVSGAGIQDNPEVKAYAAGLPDEFSSLIKEYLAEYGAGHPVIINGTIAPGPGAVYVEGFFTDITTGSSASHTIGDFTGAKTTLRAHWAVIGPDGGKETHSETSHSSNEGKGALALRSDARRLAKHVAASIIRFIH